MRLKEDEKIAMFYVVVVFSRFHGMLFHVEHIYIFYISLSRHLLDLIVSRGTIVQFVVRRFKSGGIFAEFEKQIQKL
jgi:hypothetical protein